MIKAIITDLDGTFLNNEGNATRANVDAVEDALDKGLRVIFASGRGIDSIQRIIGSFSDKVFPIIGCSGAIVTLGKEVLFRDYIKASVAEELILWALENNLHIQSFWGHNRVIPEACTSLPYHQKTCGMHYELTKSLDTMVYGNPPLKLMITDSYKRISKIREELQSKYPELKFTMSGKNYLDIIPGNCNKGTGLKVICNIFNIQREDTIAFGNDENDLEMINQAGIGVAMINSPHSLIAAADIIAPSNDENGFAKIINDILNS